MSISRRGFISGILSVTLFSNELFAGPRFLRGRLKQPVKTVAEFLRNTDALNNAIMNDIFYGTPKQWSPLNSVVLYNPNNPGNESKETHLVTTTPGGDKLLVPMLKYEHTVDWLSRYTDENRYDIFNRLICVHTEQFKNEIEDDKWHLCLAAAADRNVICYDVAAQQGKFTPELVKLMQATTPDLTDICIGTDAFEDNFKQYFQNHTQTTQIIINGINIHPIDDLDIGYKYYNYYVDTLKASIIPGNCLAVGFSRKNDNFQMYMPDTKKPSAKHYQKKDHDFLQTKFYLGMVCYDSKNVVIGQF